MWDLVPWPGIELGPPPSGAQSLRHWLTRKVLFLNFFPKYFPSAVGWLHRCDTSRNIGPTSPHFFIGSLAMSTWVLSTSGLLWTIVLWIFVCKFLLEHLFSILGDIDQGVEFWGHVITENSVVTFEIRTQCESSRVGFSLSRWLVLFRVPWDSMWILGWVFLLLQDIMGILRGTALNL